MICPGANRAPPIAPELERAPGELEAGRIPRPEGAGERLEVFKDLAGAIVSCARASESSPTRVAALLVSSRPPHSEQKRAETDDSAPQAGQSIRSKSYHQVYDAIASPIAKRVRLARLCRRRGLRSRLALLR